jgi:hypothetical protein
MLGFETGKRIGRTKLEVARLRLDVEDWKLNHDEVTRGCWAWEDVIAKANFVFGRIIKLDMDIQKFLFESPVADVDPELLSGARDPAIAWLEVSLSMRERSEQLLREYGYIDGYDELKANVRQAQAFLTPDEEYFDSEELAAARDRAIDSHHAGLTEPLLNNGNTAQ